jgi:hypothetical protein
MQANGLRELQAKYKTLLVYARGSYLASVQQAAERSKVRVMSLLTEYELSLLKRKGILWMKMGLRMRQACSVFQKRIHAIAFEKPHQMQVPM